MASKKSYKITLSNNETEKESIEYLLNINSKFILPDKESRKKILEKLDLDMSFIRSFDLVEISGHTNIENSFIINDDTEITLIEIKSTKKKLKENPFGFFFGATENEFLIASKLGERYKFCFVCLHPESKSYVLLSKEELEKKIKNKRVQYQINLKTKKDEED